ncbi:RES domain-containing protein [Caballeronia sp. BR00000012568055]|uniref:RES domain-containing protein n=1 Tax=Caballeronia sp. BR00000012568055 TaxID=2918761 RepID=UPI0023F7008A|nr:RES domain-containing protein [Caballeronia sp. BR00000012568055]
MRAGDIDVLHKVVLSKAGLGTYWHVYSSRYAPTASNPHSQARLAWRDGAHGMFYTGETRAAALWETVLRYASIDNGYVYTDRFHLKGMMLARLELTFDASVLDLRSPYRRAVVNASSELDEQWERMLKDPDHANTHNFTMRTMEQLRAAGHEHGAALRWYSRQCASAAATLFFEPRMQPQWWTFRQKDLYRLDSPEGEEQIRIALAEQGLHWRGAPVSDDFSPPQNADMNDGPMNVRH